MITLLLVVGRGPLLAIALLTGSLRAQDPATPVASESDASFSSKLDIATVEAQLAALEADSGIEDAIKELVRVKYAQAIEKLKAARQNSDREAVFRDAVQSAPGQTAEIERQVATLPPVEDAGTVLSEGSVEHLRGERASHRADLADLESRLGETLGALAEVESRPLELAAQLSVTRSELAEVETGLAALPADPGTPQQAADRLLAEGEREALASEIEMLVQERLSQPARERLLAARRDLFGKQLENERALLADIESALKQQRKTDADRVSERVDELAGAVGEGDEELGQLVAELRDLAEGLQDSAAQLKRVDEEHGALSAKSSELISEFDRLTEQAGLGGFDGSSAQVLVEQRRRLPNPRGFSSSFKARAASLREVRLAGFRIDEKVRAQVALEKQFADGRSDAVTQLVATRREALEKLDANYLNLVSALARLDADERSYRDKIVEFRDFLGDELFWQRSSPPVGANSLKDIPAAANWLFQAERWREGGRALKGIPDHYPLLGTAVMLVVLLLLAARRRIIASIIETGQRIRRVSADRYTHTAKAVLGTALLALPVPLAIGFVAWAILRDPGASDWVRGLAKGLEWSSVMIGGVWFLADSCRRGGLGIAHLGWNEHFASRLLAALRGLILVYLPSLLLISSMLFEDSSRHFDSIGRLVFNLAHLWMSLVLWKVLRPSDGLLSGLIGEYPDRFIVRCRFLWYPMLFLFPLALVVLASLGYVFTALALSLAFVASLGLVAAGSVIYGLVLRWFMFKERRLALAEAIEERNMRREAAEILDGQPGEIISPEEEEAEIDLASIGKQTRRLLRLITGVAVTVAIYWFWTATLPLDEALNRATIGGWISLLGLTQAVLVATIFTAVVRNLPGLLELAGLRTALKDPGTRYAVTTICQYAVIVVGLSMLSKILDLDWAQFGWIVAALSFGLGFGLQEVVANFVCGIILLFERPIRVGDYVTVDEVSGTVTRIRMRATAITNRDRKEFVVPNKQFITGTLMNWTLTNKVSRILITVGVAYGSDTREARRILADIADDHPLILDDPAPFATFDAFADSSLNLTLRCYLPDVETRVVTISELHTEIDERFKKAGIEIAFPQQDLHVRSIEPGVDNVVGITKSDKV